MARGRIYEQNPRKLFAFIPTSARTLLDVGCSSGEFGAFLKARREVEVWGVEPSTVAAGKARARLDRVVNGPFVETIDAPDGYFDVVVFGDSLEHFPDVGPPLALAKQKLRPGGTVVASIPNVRYIENIRHLLVEMDWRYEEQGIRDRTHLRFFTAKSIRRTFREAGYELLSLDGINPHHWSGKKMFLLRLFFGRWMRDMKFRQYVVTARPRQASPGDGSELAE